MVTRSASPLWVGKNTTPGEGVESLAIQLLIPSAIAATGSGAVFSAVFQNHIFHDRRYKINNMVKNSLLIIGDR
jgi:hypothetical protein